MDLWPLGCQRQEFSYTGKPKDILLKASVTFHEGNLRVSKLKKVTNL